MKTEANPNLTDSGNADAMADIALNSLGLILIILLIYMISFQDTSNQILDRVEQKRSEIAALQLAGKTLSNQIVEVKRQFEESENGRLTEQHIDGLWRFRVNVKRLVGEHRTETCDWVIDYQIFLDFEGSKITGTMIGAKEIKTDSHSVQTTSYAQIEGSCEPDGNLRFRLQFSRLGETGFELFEGKRTEKNKIIGELIAGKQLPGYRNYEGPVEARKMIPADFEM